MARGCPECEVTTLYAEFLGELDDELGAHAEKEGLALPGRGKEFRWPWSRSKLINDVGTISSMDARVDGKGYRGDWPQHIKNLVQILRQEKALQERVEHEEAKREAERKHGRRDGE